MAQKKVGFTNTSNVQGDKLIINNGLTSSINFLFTGGSTLTFSLPKTDGSAGWAIITDGSGRLSFGTVSGAGNVQGTGTTPKLAYWTGTSSLGSSLLEEGSGQLLFPSGTTAAPGISFLLDTDTGLRRNAANEVSIVGGGTDLATFNTSGVKVGAVTYTDTDGPSSYVLATDGSGSTYWVENIIGSTGATGPTGSYITSGYSVSSNELIFTLNTGGTVSVTGSFAGSSGTSGIKGATGTNGSSGTSGVNGTSGTSGLNGTSGTSGLSGSSGTSGTSGIKGATGSLDATLIEGWLNTASYSTQISSLTNNANWTVGNTFSGSVNSTYQGQRYYQNPYVYDAVADNQWVRTTIGLGVTGPSGTSGTSGSAGTSGTTGTSGTSGTSGTRGTSGTSGANGTSGTSGVNGTSGTSGNTGTSGTSGNTGTSGTSGNTGTSGTSGINGIGNATMVGTTNYVAKFTGATAVGNSLIVDNGTVVNVPSYAQNVVSNTSVTGTFTQSLSNSNTYAYTLTGNTTFNYSNPTMSVYNFFIKGGSFTFTLDASSAWQTVGATALGYTGSFVMSCMYDGTDMWVSAVKNYASY